MPSLTDVFSQLEKLESAYITVRQNRCVKVRNRNAHCLKCADACTSGCISFSKEGLCVAPEKCTGCGTCATVCLTCALETHLPNDAELLQSLKTVTQAAGGICTIACTQMLKAEEGLYDSEKVVGATCLGRIEESLLVSMATSGATQINLVKTQCEKCSYVTGSVTAQSVCDSTNILFMAWKSSVRVKLLEKLPKELIKVKDKANHEDTLTFPLSTKEQEKGVATTQQDDGVAATPQDGAAQKTTGKNKRQERRYMKVLSDGTLPHFLPDRRERLLNNLAELGEPEDALINTRLWGHIEIASDLCSSCRMCATFCPTGAIIKFEDENGVFGVDHYPGDCVKCRCCADICPEKAITISEEVCATGLLSGVVDRYEMKKRENPHGTPQSINGAIKSLVSIDQVYDR